MGTRDVPDHLFLSSDFAWKHRKDEEKFLKDLTLQNFLIQTMLYEIFSSPETDDLEKVYALINTKLKSGASFMEAYDQMLDDETVSKIWDAFCVEAKDRMGDEIEDEEAFGDELTEALEEFCDSEDE